MKRKILTFGFIGILLITFLFLCDLYKNKDTAKAAGMGYISISTNQVYNPKTGYNDYAPGPYIVTGGGNTYTYPGTPGIPTIYVTGAPYMTNPILAPMGIEYTLQCPPPIDPANYDVNQSPPTTFSSGSELNLKCNYVKKQGPNGFIKVTSNNYLGSAELYTHTSTTNQFHPYVDVLYNGNIGFDSMLSMPSDVSYYIQCNEIAGYQAVPSPLDPNYNYPLRSTTVNLPPAGNLIFSCIYTKTASVSITSNMPMKGYFYFDSSNSYDSYADQIYSGGGSANFDSVNTFAYVGGVENDNLYTLHCPAFSDNYTVSTNMNGVKLSPWQHYQYNCTYAIKPCVQSLRVYLEGYGKNFQSFSYDEAGLSDFMRYFVSAESYPYTLLVSNSSNTFDSCWNRANSLDMTGDYTPAVQDYWCADSTTCDDILLSGTPCTPRCDSSGPAWCRYSFGQAMLVSQYAWFSSHHDFVVAKDGSFTIYQHGNGSYHVVETKSEICSGTLKPDPQIPTNLETSVLVYNLTNEIFKFKADNPTGGDLSYTYSIDTQTYDSNGGSASSGNYTTGAYSYNLSYGSHIVYYKATNADGFSSVSQYSFVIPSPGTININITGIPAGQGGFLLYKEGAYSLAQGNTGSTTISLPNISAANYQVFAVSVAGYTATVTPAVTTSLAAGQTLTFDIVYTLTFGTINVNIAGVPTGQGGFYLYKNSAFYSWSSTTKSWPNMSAAIYQVVAVSVVGYTVTVTPSVVTPLIAGQTITFNINYVTPPPTASNLSFVSSINRGGQIIAGVTVTPSGADNYNICTDTITCTKPVRVGDQVLMDFYLVDQNGNIFTSGNYSTVCTLINPDTGARSACSSTVNPTIIGGKQRATINLIEAGTIELKIMGIGSGNTYAKTVTIRVPRIKTLE